MEKEVQKRERFFLYTSLFRAGVEWLTSVIASLLIHPSDRMAYSSFPGKGAQTLEYYQKELILIKLVQP